MVFPLQSLPCLFCGYPSCHQTAQTLVCSQNFISALFYFEELPTAPLSSLSFPFSTSSSLFLFPSLCRASGLFRWIPFFRELAGPHLAFSPSPSTLPRTLLSFLCTLSLANKRQKQPLQTDWPPLSSFPPLSLIQSSLGDP